MTFEAGSTDISLVDTDVWSYVTLKGRDRDPRGAGWRRVLLGRQLVIAAQTAAELQYGALIRNWGRARQAELQERLARTPVAYVNADVVLCFAELRSACHQAGHPLSQKVHMGDAWIAATAIAHRLPLLSGDDVFRNAPGVSVLSESD